jgi:ketosteroid isomerase-like protein
MPQQSAFLNRTGTAPGPVPGFPALWSKIDLSFPRGFMKSRFSISSSLLTVVAGVVIVVLLNLTIPKAHSASATAGADTLRQLEADFMKAAADKGAPGYMSYYAEDAAELPNGDDILQGKEIISKTMGFLDDKNNHLTWTPVFADMAASGDLGYTYGTYEFRSKDKDGKAVTKHGKYASVWKKQKDGSWKVVMDMGNSSSDPKS